MFRSALELELLAQAKVDDFNAARDRELILVPSKTESVITRIRRRCGMTLIDAGARLAGTDLPAVATPAVAGR